MKNCQLRQRLPLLHAYVGLVNQKGCIVMLINLLIIASSIAIAFVVYKIGEKAAEMIENKRQRELRRIAHNAIKEHFEYENRRKMVLEAFKYDHKSAVLSRLIGDGKI